MKKLIFLVMVLLGTSSFAQVCAKHYVCMGWCETLIASYDYAVDFSAIKAFNQLERITSCEDKLYAVDPATGLAKKDAAGSYIIATPFNTCSAIN